MNGECGEEGAWGRHMVRQGKRGVWRGEVRSGVINARASVREGGLCVGCETEGREAEDRHRGVSQFEKKGACPGSMAARGHEPSTAARQSDSLLAGMLGMDVRSGSASPAGRRARTRVVPALPCFGALSVRGCHTTQTPDTKSRRIVGLNPSTDTDRSPLPSTRVVRPSCRTWARLGSGAKWSLAC